MQQRSIRRLGRYLLGNLQYLKWYCRFYTHRYLESPDDYLQNKLVGINYPPFLVLRLVHLLCLLSHLQHPLWFLRIQRLYLRILPDPQQDFLWHLQFGLQHLQIQLLIGLLLGLIPLLYQLIPLLLGLTYLHSLGIPLISYLMSLHQQSIVLDPHSKYLNRHYKIGYRHCIWISHLGMPLLFLVRGLHSRLS